jgi:hypothetical protein
MLLRNGMFAGIAVVFAASSVRAETARSETSMPDTALFVSAMAAVDKGSHSEVVIDLSGPAHFRSSSSEKGGNTTIQLDLLDVHAEPRRISPTSVMQKPPAFQAIDAGTRVTFALRGLHTYDVRGDGNHVVIVVDHAALVVTKTAAKVAQANTDGFAGRSTSMSDVEPMIAQSGARQMTYIGFRNAGAQSRVYARMNDTATYTVRKEGDNLIILEIQNATIPLRNNKNHLDTTFFDSPVKMITPSEVEDASPTIRIAIEMKQAVPFSHKLEGRDIVVTFQR